MLDVLAIGAHPDDVEIGLGGTLARLVSQGYAVGILDLTNGEPTPFGSVPERKAESEAAAKVLQVAKRITLDLPNRELQDTIEARRKVAEVLRVERPHTLFVHYWDDAHPDHVAASRLCDAARFYAKLTKTKMAGEPWLPKRTYYYFSIHLRLHPDPAFIMDITDQIEQKIESVRCYYTQFVKGRGETGFFDGLRDKARYWGELIGTRYGEPFAVREKIGLSGLRELV